MLDEIAYYSWIMMRRFQATGILRPTAEATIWSACHEAPKRKLALAQLLEEGLLIVTRIDSRLEKGIWMVSRWWWESDIKPTVDLLDALRKAVENFLHYLRADGVCIDEDVDQLVKQTIHEASVQCKSNPHSPILPYVV